jgi:hypothetical protein
MKKKKTTLPALRALKTVFVAMVSLYLRLEAAEALTGTM